MLSPHQGTLKMGARAKGLLKECVKQLLKTRKGKKK